MQETVRSKLRKRFFESQKCVKMVSIVSSLSLTIRERQVLFIKSWLSPTFGRFEELLLGSAGSLQGCLIRGPTSLEKFVFRGLRQLMVGLWSGLAMFYNKLSSFGA